MKLDIKGKVFEFPEPAVMGILNITPDSFSDGGCFLDRDTALHHAEKMVRDGAHLIDVGGESTRPGSQGVSPGEEMERVLPVIEAIKKNMDIIVSIDSTKENVVRAAVAECGADVVNDISALRFSAGMADTVASLQVPVILMHMKGSPRDMQEKPEYEDVVKEISGFFRERIEIARRAGIRQQRIILDPGIGFGKTVGHNIEILHRLPEFYSFSLPVMIGLSRKSFLGSLGGIRVPAEREIETMTANIVAMIQGAAIIRVHDVHHAVRSATILKRIMPTR